MMKRVLPIVLSVATVVFVWIAWVQSGGVERHRMLFAHTPEEAVRLLLTAAKSRNWDAAYSRLANAGDVEKAAFARDLGGSNGSLRTYATLENFNVWGLHADNQEATVRAKLHYSTAVGPLDDVRDIKVRNDGSGTWKVVWSTSKVPKLAPQVIPVNYLRWDVINRGAEDDWGVQNVDSPQVRIVSMNALQRPDRVVILGEIVNEDTIPASINVGATLLRPDGNPITQDTCSDKTSQVML